MTLYDLAFRLFSLFPAELAHEIVFGGLRASMRVPGVRRATAHKLAPSDPALAVRAFGTMFPGPLGLAAGFDKNALGPDALAALGFGFVEVGTVTARPQPGNDKPRLFRLKADRALVNRMGFNNDGAERVRERLLQRAPRSILAVNIGKTKVVSEAEAAYDYAASARALGRFAAFVVVNVSSPNTPGLRDLQRAEALAPILREVRAALDESTPERRVPLLVKIAPDLADADVDAVADLALSLGLDGIVATNTTIRREGLASAPSTVVSCGAGGLSGPPLKARSLALLERLYARVGREVAIVSAGGIANADDAWERIVRGATLLELYTSFIYEGPLVAHRIHEGLRAKLHAHSMTNIEQAIGSATRGHAEHVRPTSA